MQIKADERSECGKHFIGAGYCATGEADGQMEEGDSRTERNTDNDVGIDSRIESHTDKAL
jgi:hypothetical protein